MRVAILAASAQQYDAIGNQIAAKVNFFMDRNAEVRVFVASGDRLHEDIVSCVEVVDSRTIPNSVRQCLVTADLILIEYSQWFDLLQVIPALAHCKPRIIFDYHGVTPAEMWPIQGRDLLARGESERGLFWSCDAVVAHSSFAAQHLPKLSDFDPQRVDRLGYPLKIERFASRSQTTSFREKLAVEDAPLVLCVGRVAANKRLPVLIDALARLPDVHAAIVGADYDIYAAEAQRCRAIAKSLHVDDRVHWLGQIDDAPLADAYRSAVALVVPSVHECFCIPAIEAMASGLPVIAARTSALPERLGDAGLTFIPDDAADLARQIRRVFQGSDDDSANRPFRVAVVSFRFAAGFVGGAEVSLRTMALALQQAGHRVEVLTTCTRAENDWHNELPAGETHVDGLTVRRFAVDPVDRNRHLTSVRDINEANGCVSAEVEADYLRHSIHSAALIDELRSRISEFDAVIVGPYLFGLTHDVACEFPDKTLLVPCFHDEPFARLSIWPKSYEKVGGILYHSPEEQQWAQTESGLNHPNAHEVGTLVQASAAASAKKPMNRYVVYCGRYSIQKEFPRLVDFACRYNKKNPGRWRFAFIGQGEQSPPRESWAEDFGFLSEDRKHQVLAGASALVQLSRQESLSIVTLEAWLHGVPVIANKACAVIAGQIERSGGGVTVDAYDEFAAALDDLWNNPAKWQGRGESGRQYVRQRYTSESCYAERIVEAIRKMKVPIARLMQQRGLKRAGRFGKAAWLEEFGRLVDKWLEMSRRVCETDVEIEAEFPRFRGQVGASLFAPLRVTNRGTHAVMPDGPGRTLLVGRVIDLSESRIVIPRFTAPLPKLLVPGSSDSVAARIPMPASVGDYRIDFWTETDGFNDKDGDTDPVTQTSIDLTIGTEIESSSTPSWERIQEHLGEIDSLRKLPEDYVDVTEGWLAEWKRRIKQKLLNNFKRAYVDVVSRQQSRVNQQVLAALQEVSRCCATLEHAVQQLQSRVDDLEGSLQQSESTTKSSQV